MTDIVQDAGITVVPLRGVRGMIADKMQKSLSEAAQLTHHAEFDATTLNAKKSALADAGTKVSVEDLLIETVVAVLQRHADINGTMQGKEVHLSASVDLSVAMALPGNLLVAPAIFNAQDKSLEELRAARQDLSVRAKTNKLSVTEMTKGSFSISNLGLSRVHQFTPILNTPQIGILGVGCAVPRAAQGERGIELRPYIGLSLTFDHRAIDGAPAADFLTDLCNTLEKVS